MIQGFFVFCNYYFSCFVNLEDFILCSSGSFVLVRSIYCYFCLIGLQCLFEKFVFYFFCVNGFFLVVENVIICIECFVGLKCFNFVVGLVECENGIYSKVGVTYCIECLSGYR